MKTVFSGVVFNFWSEWLFWPKYCNKLPMVENFTRKNFRRNLTDISILEMYLRFRKDDCTANRDTKYMFALRKMNHNCKCLMPLYSEYKVVPDYKGMPLNVRKYFARSYCNRIILTVYICDLYTENTPYIRKKKTYIA